MKIHEGKVEKGKLHLFNEMQFYIALSSMEGKYVDVIVRKKKSQRSTNQNSYYHGVVVRMLSDFLGYERDEMHMILRFKFLRKVADNGIESAMSTTKLSTEEMEDFLERVRRWAAKDLNFYIPLPNEVQFDIDT